MLSSDISLYLLLSRQVNTERQGTAEHANNIMEYKLKMKGFLIYQFTKCLYRYLFLLRQSDSAQENTTELKFISNVNVSDSLVYYFTLTYSALRINVDSAEVIGCYCSQRLLLVWLSNF
jgi:hypothetical protein